LLPNADDVNSGDVIVTDDSDVDVDDILPNAISLVLPNTNDDGWAGEDEVVMVDENEKDEKVDVVNGVATDGNDANNEVSNVNGLLTSLPVNDGDESEVPPLL
jgi:hypothetical protein